MLPLLYKGFKSKSNTIFFDLLCSLFIWLKQSFIHACIGNVYWIVCMVFLPNSSPKSRSIFNPYFALIFLCTTLLPNFHQSCIVCNFYLLILEIMFLFFKNTVKYKNSGIHFTIFLHLNELSLSKQQHLC